MQPVTHLSIAGLAAQQFRNRQSRAREVVRNRGMALRTAEQHLRPWLAIACLCGADLPELVEPVRERRAQIDEKPQGPRSVTDDVQTSAILLDMESRWLAADDICPRPAWVPVLAAARDDAFNRYLADSTNDALTSAAAALQRLCMHLHYDINGCHVPQFAVAERGAAEPSKGLKAPSAQAAAA